MRKVKCGIENAEWRWLVRAPNHVTAVLPQITAVTAQPTDGGKMQTSNAENASNDAIMRFWPAHTFYTHSTPNNQPSFAITTYTSDMMQLCVFEQKTHFNLKQPTAFVIRLQCAEKTTFNSDSGELTLCPRVNVTSACLDIRPARLRIITKNWV